MGKLKEDIKRDLFLKNPKDVMEVMQFYRHIQANNKATHKYTTITYA